MSYVHKYIPRTTSDLKGQDAAVIQLKGYLQDQKKNAAMLFGPVGCGKTASIYAIAEELNLDVFEVNASDSRSKKSIEEVIGAAARQQSLIGFGKKKVILIDEIDGMSGTKDRGGVPAIIKIMEQTPFPIVMTANDPFNKKFSKLRRKVQMIEYSALDYVAVFERLKEVATLEGIKFEESALRDLARRCGGDMRAALTDLEILGVTKEIKNLDALGDRERTEKIQEVLFRIFKTTDPLIAKQALDTVSEDMDQIILWLEENIPREYEGLDTCRAMDRLSRADVYRGRIRRWQHWRFIATIYPLLSAGIAVSKDEKNKKMIEYKQNGRILKIWMANMKYMKRKAIAEKIAEKTHTSSKRVLHDILPHIQFMIQKGNTALIKEFQLEPEEVVWLKK